MGAVTERATQPTAPASGDGNQRQAATSEAVLAAIRRLTRVIASGRTMEPVFSAFADELRAFLPFDRFAFAYLDPAGKRLRAAHVRGPLPGYSDDGMEIPVAGTAAGWAVEHGQPLIHAIGETDRFVEDADRRAAGVAEIVVLPVVVDGGVVGAIALSSRRPGVYHPDDLWLLEAFADHLGLAVAATNLRREAERRAMRGQCLAEIGAMLAATPDPGAILDSVLDRAATVLGDINAVLIAAPDSADLHPAAVRAASSDARSAARELFAVHPPPGALAVIAPAATRSDVVVSDFTDERLPARFRRDAARLGLQALLAVPMVERGQLVGVYVTAQTERAATSGHGERLAAGDLDLAREVAHRLASALLSARLHADTRQALTESEALRRIGQELSSSVEVEQIFELISSFARLLLAGDFAAVAVQNGDGDSTWEAFIGNRADAHRAARFPPGSGLAGRAVTSRRAVVVQGLPDNPAYPPEGFPVLHAEGARSALAVPLRIGDRVLGGLIVGFRRPRAITAADVRLGEALAAQAAIALENARLFTEAQRAIAERDRFLSVAAHELRTPLTTLRGRVQLLNRRLYATLTPATADALQIILRQVDRLGHMVTDLLDISRVQSGRLPLVRERMDLVPHVRRAVSDAAEGEPGPDLSFECDVPELVAWIDPWRIDQVLANLLENARRFTPPEGHVRVRLRREGDLARIEVSDTGAGIAQEHLDRIFEPFYQVQPEPRTGIGLGLAICRQIVVDHGGRLWSESAGSGQGSTFIMTLPLGDPGPPQPIDPLAVSE
jgi:signal transduction histidine kinase